MVYDEWRHGVELLEVVRRFSFLYDAGAGYNFRQWHQHPKFRRFLING